jgi:hypothetical protein
MATKIYVGLDVGSRTCYVVAPDPRGSVLRNTQSPTSEVRLLRALIGSSRDTCNVGHRVKNSFAGHEL